MKKLDDTETLLMSIYSQYSNSYLNCDIETLSSILADEWSLVTADCGGEDNKIGQLRALENGVLQVEKIEDSDVKIKLYDTAALITGRRKSSVMYNGNDVSDFTHFSQFYALQKGQWQCVRTHITSILANPERHPA